jgi:hypothetical protein
LTRIYFILLPVLFSITLYAEAQDDTVDFKYGDYYFHSVYDTANFCSNLTIYKNKTKIFTDSCIDKIMSIAAYDLEGNGDKVILVEYYTGGAHCCTYVEACKFVSGRYRVLDTLFWGNSGYSVVDYKKDGKMEIEGSNDMFAYAFTNFAQSFFSYSIYRFKNGRFYLANTEFSDSVENHIKELKSYLDEYLINGFDCPKSPDEDTFNTDAGAVKAILAPIVADYYSIGRTKEGYDLINKVYNCNDKEKFIEILKKEFNLK